MSNNAKQRLTLTDLKEPQQMRELNRQLSWIWDQLLGGLNMKSLDAGTRQVIEDKAGRSELTQTAGEIRTEVADEVSGLQSQIDQTPEKIELAVKEVQVGGRNYILGTGAAYTATGTGNRHWLFPWKCANAEKAQSLFGKTLTISFDYDAAITDGSFQVLTSNTWQGVKTFSSNDGAGHFVRTMYVNDSTAADENAIYIDGAWTGSVVFSHVKVEIGNKATDWSPAPEDTDAAIGNIQVGGPNYLLNSDTPVSNSNYNIANYKFSDNFKPQAGETYTIRIWGSIASDRTSLGVYNTNGYIRLGAVSDNGDGTYSLTFKWRNDAVGYPEYSVESPRQIQLYQAPRDATGVSTITRIKLEAGNKATDWTRHPEEFQAGTNVLINKNEFRVTTPEFNVNITSEDGTEKMLNIDKDGIHAQSIDCPNVVQKYDGPGNITIDVNATSAQIAAGTHYRSLNALAAFLSEKRVSKQLNVSIAAGHVEYGYVKFRGIVGSYWIQLIGNSSSPAKVVGVIECSFNSTPVLLRYVNVDLDKNHSNYGVHAEGSSTTMTVRNCVITGPGVSVTNTFAVAASRNAFAYVYDCELYDCMRSLYGSLSGVISSNNCKGNCNVSASQSTLHLVGTMPCESTTWATVTKAGQVLTNNVTVDQGSKPTPEPEATSVSYTANSYDTWASGGWNVYSNNDDIYQGYTSALGEHRGCFWFDNTTLRSDLKSKTIKQATLSLYQISGVGRNQPVQVSLEGITVSYGGSQPFGATEHEYGVIGTTLGVNQTTTFTIPTKAITHLVNGDINGFMLRTGETSVMTGDDNSYNYARFVGKSNSSYRPKLTITYA